MSRQEWIKAGWFIGLLVTGVYCVASGVSQQPHPILTDLTVWIFRPDWLAVGTGCLAGAWLVIRRK
jgi:hypothetical protein